jgi:hypothetical protein
LNVQNGGSVLCLDDLSIGRFVDAVGHTIVSGGLLSLPNDTLWAGREGIGELTVNAGTVRARNLFVGRSEDGTNAPQGTVTLLGGITLISSNLTVGTTLLSTGQVTVAGGTLMVTNAARSAFVSVASGTFTLQEGEVAADQLLLTDTNGQFNFTGGTLQLRSLTASNGAAFVVGDGLHPATLELQGGIYSFADGLVIASNATVTGCGTIVGTISNSGTLSTNCGPAGPVISSITKTGNVATVSFASVSGTNYLVEFKDVLSDLVWIPILPALPGDGTLLSVVDTNAVTPTRFYRLHLQ